MQYSGNNMVDVKRSNRCAVLSLLHEHGGMSRKKLAEYTHLTPAAITKITGEMLEEGLLAEGKSIESPSAGRREVIVEINSKECCALGILINRCQVSLSAAWLDGSEIFCIEEGKDILADAEKLCAYLSARILALAEEYNLPSEKILGLGLAVRGITSPDRRLLSNSFEAIDRENFPICQRFEELTGLPVVMANNVRALLASHMFLEGSSSSGSRFFLRCEDGIGASLAVNNRIWYGSTGQCSEIGHVPVVRRGGKTCSCGKSGCLETVASPRAILEDANAVLSEDATPILWKRYVSGGNAITLDDVFASAQSGDAEVAKIVDNAVVTLGAAIKGIIYCIDPDEIILYGRLFDSQYYLTKLMADLSDGVDSSHTTVIKKSPYNHLLDSKSACLIMFGSFFRNGGIRLG